MSTKSIFYRPTCAEIDLSAIAYNYHEIKKLVGNKTKIMAVVKANAYGHGIINIAKILATLNVDYFGVATLDEAISLRKNNIKTPILVLGCVTKEEIKPIIENDITMTLGSDEILPVIEKYASSLKKQARVHVKIDTGMGRIGVWHREAISFIRLIAKSSFINLEGIYTHFASAGHDNFFTNYQLESFEEIINEIAQIGIDIPIKHVANSIGVIDIPRSHFNLVRPGIIIYGMYPKRHFVNIVKLKPAMSLKTKIVFLKDTPAGRSISYGRTYITQKPTKVATLPIGYADGYGRILSNKAEVLIRGKRAKVIGKVTMDQTMIDVGHIKDVKVGDEVMLIGRQGKDIITVDELAKLSATIPYEIVCSITDRVPRSYKR